MSEEQAACAMLHLEKFESALTLEKLLAGEALEAWFSTQRSHSPR
jgi:hypothetical protein